MLEKEINIKAVPEKQGERDLIALEAGKLRLKLIKGGRFTGKELEEAAKKLLAKLGLKENYLGFAMLAINNDFWKAKYSAVPGNRRLLLLPKCLRDAKKCRGKFDSEGTLLCAECGACNLSAIKKEAKKLGCDFMIAEGSPAVINKILSNKVDAIFGVACMDSLEKVFPKANRLGIPNIAVSLFKGGCVNTSLDMKEFMAWLRAAGEGETVEGTPTLLPLARAAYSMFEDKAFEHLIPANLIRAGGKKDVKRLAGEWIKRDGKRLRTIFTLAAYVSAKYGKKALEYGKPAAEIPDGVKRIALAVEILHKASLVHDDIEDEDKSRYGEKTLNAEYGTPIALNAGDYLVGLGYKLISSGKKELGAEACADILDKISETYLKMADGQGRELAMRDNKNPAGMPQVLDIYRLKTSSAFEIALYCGLRAAGNVSGKDFSLAGKYSEYAGMAFQIFDDIKDWDGTKRKEANIRALLNNPGVIRAIARGAGLQNRLNKIYGSSLDTAGKISALKKLYESEGIIRKAKKLAEIYRKKADETAGKLSNKTVGSALLLLSKLTFKD